MTSRAVTSPAVTGRAGGATEHVGTVARLGLTPLKGAAHLHPERIAVRRDEVVGDRRWALIQPVASGWRIVRTVESPRMTAVRARRDAGGALFLELPGGRRFVVDGAGSAGAGDGAGAGVAGADAAGADAAGVIAEYWGRPTYVRLVPGQWDRALSDLLGREVHLVTVDRAGAVVFAEPVSIVTTSSVREIARRAGVSGGDPDGGHIGVGASGVDDERFRSTVVIDTPDLFAFAEDGWVGGRLRVGSVELIVRQRLARCGVIRIQPGTSVVGGPDPLRLLAADRVVHGEVVFGLGAAVAVPGEIAVGDPVRLTRWGS